jgi:hypothetical protein
MVRLQATLHVAVLLSLWGQGSNVFAEPIRIAVLGSPGGGEPWNADVQRKLASTGFFATVDTFLINTTRVTGAQLARYNSVLVYSDSPGYADPAEFGNTLSNYVDGGGGVVTAVFTNASIPIEGRFAADNYFGILPLAQTEGTRLSLGNVYDPESPLMNGVQSFDGGSSSYRSTGGVHPAARRIADWSDGSPLVVTRDIGIARRVDLNFFPVSDAQRQDFWVESTDGALLMANALRYAAQVDGAPVPEPSTLVLLGAGALTIARRAWKKRHATPMRTSPPRSRGGAW